MAKTVQRSEAFLKSIARLFFLDIQKMWITGAATAHEEIKTASTEQKLDIFDRHFQKVCDSTFDICGLLVHDLARFLQTNTNEVKIDEKKWMRYQVDEIWRKVLTLEKWVEWLALACDGLDAGPGEIVHWQPPLWLSSSSHSHASVGRMNRARLAKSIKAEEEILRMHVLLCQGGEIPPGLMGTRHGAPQPSGQLRERASGQLTEQRGERLGEQQLSKRLAEQLGEKLSKQLAAIHLGTRKKRRKRTKSEAQQEREQVIKDVSRSGLKGMKYCFKLDKQGLRTRRSWHELGCPERYPEAYKQPQVGATDKRRKIRLCCSE